MQTLNSQVSEPAIIYVQNFKVRLLERLFSEQIDALSRINTLSEQERAEYWTRESRIAKLTQDLGLESTSAPNRN